MSVDEALQRTKFIELQKTACQCSTKHTLHDG